MKIKKQIVMSREQLLIGWLGEMCRRGYCEDYIGVSTVDFYNTIDVLNASGEFIFRDEE